MWERLAKIARRYEEVTAMLSDPGTYGDLEKMKDLSREPVRVHHRPILMSSDGFE